MKKTKIEFADIKAGDLIETVDIVHGVKWVLSGIVFEKFGLGGEQEWRTSQGGNIVDESDTLIYRIDVAEVKFEDIRKGDKLRVTTVQGGREVVVTDVADQLVGPDFNRFWINEQALPIVYRMVYSDMECIIEILERAE